MNTSQVIRRPNFPAHTAKLGRAHKHPTSSSRTGIPGISFSWRYRQDIPALHITATWYEGVELGRKQRKTDFSTEVYGNEGAVQAALLKRFEKTGIKQMSAAEAWEKILLAVLDET